MSNDPTIGDIVRIADERGMDVKINLLPRGAKAEPSDASPAEFDPTKNEVIVSMSLSRAKGLLTRLRVIHAGLVDNGMDALAVELKAVADEWLVYAS